jgi:hypothetical protein
MTARSDERGATVLIVALSVTALFAVVGIAIDGGAAFSDRRQMQNVADAAALAGAAQVDKFIRGEDGTPASVWNAVVLASSTDNRSNQTPLCMFIDETGVTLDTAGMPIAEASAPQCNTFPAVPTNAAGVLVLARDTQKTLFMRVVGIGSFDAEARAKATVQAIDGEVLGTFPSPFMICAIADDDRRSPLVGDGYDPTHPSGLGLPGILLEPPVGQDDLVIVNPAALGKNYPIQYPNGNKPEFPRCGQGNVWKGNVDPFPKDEDDPFSAYPIPGNWVPEHGDLGTNGREVAKRASVPGTCVTASTVDDNLTGCMIDLPICYPGIASGTLRCIGRGRFALQNSGRSSEVNGIFVGESPDVLHGGQGGGKPGVTGQRVVKLVE